MVRPNVTKGLNLERLGHGKLNRWVQNLCYSGCSCFIHAKFSLQEPYGQCRKCECNNNTDPSIRRNCDITTGECFDCLHNTTGFNCEWCAPEFHGSALNKTCTRMFVLDFCCETPGPNTQKRTRPMSWYFHGQSYRWFSRNVITAMLVDENKRSLINSFCSSTGINVHYTNSGYSTVL